MGIRFFAAQIKMRRAGEGKTFSNLTGCNAMLAKRGSKCQRAPACNMRNCCQHRVRRLETTEAFACGSEPLILAGILRRPARRDSCPREPDQVAYYSFQD
jgi:hypothetical protein